MGFLQNFQVFCKVDTSGSFLLAHIISVLRQVSFFPTGRIGKAPETASAMLLACALLGIKHVVASRKEKNISVNALADLWVLKNGKE